MITPWKPDQIILAYLIKKNFYQTKSFYTQHSEKLKSYPPTF